MTQKIGWFARAARKNEGDVRMIEKRIDYIFSYGPTHSSHTEQWNKLSGAVDSGAIIRISYDGYCGVLQMLTRKEIVSCNKNRKRIVYGLIFFDEHEHTTYNISGVKLDDIELEVVDAKTAD